MAGRVLDNKISGGLADGKAPEDIAKKHKVKLSTIMQQLDTGIKVELEHVTSKDIAREIVLDHLYEDPKYYSKLKTVENKNILRDQIRKIIRLEFKK